MSIAANNKTEAMMKTPRNLVELSAEWISEGLREAGVLTDASVVDIGVTRIGDEVGFLSSVGRVRLKYDRPEENAPDSVVVKLEPDAGEFRSMGEELHAFEREIRFYQQVASTAPIRLAKLYFAATDPPDYAMVIEDLSFARPGDQVAGLHARQVIKGARVIGQLQGRFWNNNALGPLSWMPDSNAIDTDYREEWPSFVKNFGYCVGEEGVELGERLGTSLEWLDQEIKRRPQTLVHTDLRADNMMLGPEDTPEEIIILDWQLTIRSMGAFDVARLMGGSELPEERHGHQLDALRAWYDALIEEGVSDYSWDDALRDLRLGALSVLTFPVHFHRAVIGATGRSLALVEVICQRLFDSAVEMDAGSVLP